MPKFLYFEDRDADIGAHIRVREIKTMTPDGGRHTEYEVEELPHPNPSARKTFVDFWKAIVEGKDSARTHNG